MNKLNPIQVKSISEKGMYTDGQGLYLKVTKAKTKSWIFRYQINGLRTEMGLGSAYDITLKEARNLAHENRLLIAKGINPKIKRDNDNATKQKRAWTFDDCAAAYLKAHKAKWKNQKHVQQWYNTLAMYASPAIGKMPVEAITVSNIESLLMPIWATKTETASRLRGRIEKVLSWAIVKKYRPAPNPAVWRGNLSELLPQQNKIQTIKHHNAMAYSDIAEFMRDLKTVNTISARALEFTIYTACRTNEVLGATWEEIDFVNKVWTIPASRMKINKTYRVPLSNQALQLLNALPKTDTWIFPSPQNGKHLSNMAMLKVLKVRLNKKELTVHGFRSTFRDWVAEMTNTPREVAEKSLSHTIKDKAEAAYQRGDMLDKRKLLMQKWADYTTGLIYKNNVIQFNQSE